MNNARNKNTCNNIEQLLQHDIETTETYCNISSSTTATIAKKHLLQQPKKITLQHSKSSVATSKENHCNMERFDPESSPKP
jgi:hypothetical protein